MRDWKACERRVAELLGDRRVPVSGRTRGDCPDIEHPTLSIECRSRTKLPAWIEDAMNQAEASARGRQLPVVVLHEDRAPCAQSLVVARLQDFADHLKKGGGG
jgi:hypothetical protein